MNKIHLMLFLFCFLIFQNFFGQKIDNTSTPYITSNQTIFQDIFIKSNNSTVEWSTDFDGDNISNDIVRTTVLHRIDTPIELEVENIDSNKMYTWKIFRCTNAEDYKTTQQITNADLNIVITQNCENNSSEKKYIKTLETSLNKLRLRFNKLNDPITCISFKHDIYDTYIINLYENGNYIDYMYVFIIYKEERNKIIDFDNPYIPNPEIPSQGTDGVGHKSFKEYRYPQVGGFGAVEILHTDGKKHFGWFYDDGNLGRNSPSPRKGSGMMNNTIPSSNDLHSDHINSLGDLYIDNSGNVIKDYFYSRSTRNPFTYYTHNRKDTDYYYGISFYIDSKFKTDSLDYTILLNIHQEKYPSVVRESNSAILHLSYVDDNTFSFGYGLSEISRFSKEFYLENSISGRWIDVIFRFKWQNVNKNHVSDVNTLTPFEFPHSNFNKTDGVMEMWISNGLDDNFHKVKFDNAVGGYHATPDPNDNDLRYGPSLSLDKTIVYGPNMDNSIPLYFGLTQYRELKKEFRPIVNGATAPNGQVVKDGTIFAGNRVPINITNTVYYDELIINDNLQPVLNHFGKKVGNPSTFKKDLIIGKSSNLKKIKTLNDSSKKEGKPIIYPNPFSNIIHLKSSEGIISYNIKGSNGIALIVSKQIINKDINLEFLKTGIYILELLSENEIFRYKIIKR
ncbi:T9SS type A sorting domain-containing protein [Aquimarina longa]|uniref:T9SS type A sorting domain-containing protein n=1 Tax=Aquimarina longa TaxID=1080221 RepID=UPI000785460A|nr:heparin lyase I family protein [Aquimarina longa]